MSHLLSTEDLRLVELASDDLSHIENSCAPTASVAQLRRLSAQLRHLLVEGRLSKCWRTIGFEKQPKIIAEKMHSDSQTNNSTVVVGQAKLDGLTIGAMFISNTFYDINDPVQRHKLQAMTGNNEYDFTLSEFLDSCAIWYANTKISRRQIISFTANKLGGVHLDGTRKKDDAAFLLLDELQENGPFMGGHSSTESNPKDNFDGIDGARGPIGFQMLAIAQNLISSPDVKLLRDRCAQIMQENRNRLKPL